MKSNILKSKNQHLISVFYIFAMASSTLLSSCNGDDDPVKEDTPEMITRVALTFSPAGGGEAVVVVAIDPDGAGVQDLETDGPILLQANASYTLSIELLNHLVNPSDEGYNITDEVAEEGDEHMFFFGWTDGIFSNPPGNGNIDNREDVVLYEDEDDNGLPIGLLTAWETGDVADGVFRVVLKHQPGLKTSGSSASAGETDVDVEFEIQVK